MNTLYFVEHRFARIGGSAFLELDRDSNSRQHILDLIRSGEVDPVKVLEIDEGAGTCRDVTEDFLEECAHPHPSTFHRPDAADRQAFAFDRARDARKHSESV